MAPKQLEWPSQSPDFNVIKLLWRDLKHTRKNSSVAELEQLWEEEWATASSTAMWLWQLRVIVVVFAKGGITCYYVYGVITFT